jgi:hypothetical protein
MCIPRVVLLLLVCATCIASATAAAAVAQDQQICVGEQCQLEAYDKGQPQPASSYLQGAASMFGNAAATMFTIAAPIIIGSAVEALMGGGAAEKKTVKAAESTAKPGQVCKYFYPGEFKYGGGRVTGTEREFVCKLK